MIQAAADSVQSVASFAGGTLVGFLSALALFKSKVDVMRRDVDAIYRDVRAIKRRVYGEVDT